jgi:hypothetical protein
MNLTKNEGNSLIINGLGHGINGASILGITLNKMTLGIKAFSILHW